MGGKYLKEQKLIGGHYVEMGEEILINAFGYILVGISFEMISIHYWKNIDSYH